MQPHKINASQRGRINMTFVWSRKIKHISIDQIKTVLQLWFNAIRCIALLKSTKVTFYDVSWRHVYGELRKETEGLEKLNFTKELSWRRFRKSDCCGCCQNKQGGGRQISSLGRKTGWVFANFLERWLQYKVNNHPVIKNKPIYNARNVNRWKDMVEPCIFIGLLTT